MKQLHVSNRPAAGFHLIPIGEICHRIRMGRAAGEEHDEADLNLSGKDSQCIWFPGYLLEKFQHIRIGIGLFFVWLAGDDIDREKVRWACWPEVFHCVSQNRTPASGVCRSGCERR